MQHQEGWHLLLVRPGKELTARNNFNRLGLRAYWPSYQTERRGIRRSVIPGYIFVAGPADSTFWDVVQRTEDFLSVARTYGGGPITLRPSDIQAIMKIEEGLNTPVPGKSLHSFRTGERVRFKDLGLPPGRVSKAGNEGRLWVEVDMMGAMVPIEVYPHQIEKG